MALLGNSSGFANTNTINSSPTSMGLSSQKMTAALKKVKGNIERLFEKNLADMIRGIRNNKENEAKYIAQCIEEIKQELKQDNIVLKANAIAKLTYLQMLGYDISWASFNIIEVMTSTRFTFKRIGYLSAAQCFNDNTEVIMLTTNLIRKDLNSSNMYESGVSLGALSCFVTPDLARDLANDVVTLLTSSKPYIRKRAVLLLYKIFLRYPDALRPTFARLKEKLEDPDQGVQSAAVNVICELARKNPKNYLSLAPVFFKLMTSSTNNWMLIKIIKLFGALTPFEPRLGKKLIEPLTNLINSTSAMSLLYECINTVIAVLISISSEAPGHHTTSIQLCVQKLSALIEDTDQNLKYLGLLAMGKILLTHPKAVQVHKDLILACLDDKDESIRLRALDLLYGMVSKKNIMEIVKKLLIHVEKAEGSLYRDELLSKIVQICSHNNYQHITNFEWYVSVLVELTKVEGTRHGSLIADQMLDVAVRVPSIRHFAVSQTALLIENAHLLLSGNYAHRNNMCEVLHAAAWICGEYSEHVRDPQNVLESLLRTRLAMMPGHIQSAFVQSIAKIYVRVLQNCEKEDDWDSIYSIDNLMLSKLPVFEQTDCLEAQERACSILQLVQEIDKCHKHSEKVADDAIVLFDGELGPVAPKAQRKVPVPADLDLHSWINEPPPPESSSQSEPEEQQMDSAEVTFKRPGTLNVFGDQTTQKNQPSKYVPSKEDIRKIRETRLAEMENNPHYLKSTVSASSFSSDKNLTKVASGPCLLKNVSSFDGKIPEISAVDLHGSIDIPGMVGLDSYMQQQEQTLSWQSAKKEQKSKADKGEKRSKRTKKHHRRQDAATSDDDDVITAPNSLAVVHDVNRALGDMPEGAKSTDEEEASPDTERFKALDINLDEPLKPEERLPVLHHRVTPPIPKSSSNGLILASPTTLVELDAKSKKSKKTEERAEKTGKKEKRLKKKKSKKSKENKLVEPKHDQTVGAASHSIENDVSAWLDNNEITAIEEPKKKKHSKKEKSSDGSKNMRLQVSKLLASDLSTAGDGRVLPNRSEYEETSGLCTPTQPPTGAASAQSNASSARHSPVMTSFPISIAPARSAVNWRLLARDRHLQLTYDIKTSLSEPDVFCVVMVFSSICDKEACKLELNVLDSISIKLLKDEKCGDIVKLPFDLPGNCANNTELRFLLCQPINTPQKIRGNLTYMLKTEGGSVSEKLDFQLVLRCIDLTIPATTSNESFADLLSGGELSSKHSLSFECKLSLNEILSRICTGTRCSIVETDAANSTSSLYSQTLFSHAICLLVKQQGNTVRIDGKSTDPSLIQHFMEEIRDLLLN